MLCTGYPSLPATYLDLKTVTLISGNLPVTLAVVDEVNILSENNGSGAHFVLCLETSRTVDWPFWQ
jgi:hypothetical protein